MLRCWFYRAFVAASQPAVDLLSVGLGRPRLFTCSCACRLRPGVPPNSWSILFLLCRKLGVSRKMPINPAALAAFVWPPDSCITVMALCTDMGPVIIRVPAPISRQSVSANSHLLYRTSLLPLTSLERFRPPSRLVSGPLVILELSSTFPSLQEEPVPRIWPLFLGQLCLIRLQSQTG